MSATGNFEAKLHAFRRTQEGVVVSYVVHPNDVSAALATAPLGTRYMIGFAQIGDDGKPIEQPKPAAKPVASKDRQRFDSLPLSQQAALRCNDMEFRKWLGVATEIDAARKVRVRCQVQSRAAFDSDPDAIRQWNALDADFQAYRTTQQYAEQVR